MLVVMVGTVSYEFLPESTVSVKQLNMEPGQIEKQNTNSHQLVGASLLLISVDTTNQM